MEKIIPKKGLSSVVTMYLDETWIPCLCWWCSGTDCTRTRHSQAFNLLQCSQQAQTEKLLFKLSCPCVLKTNAATLNLLGHCWACGEKDRSKQEFLLPFHFSIKQMGMWGKERNGGTNGWADSCLQSVHLKWPSNYYLGQTGMNKSLHY